MNDKKNRFLSVLIVLICSSVWAQQSGAPSWAPDGKSFVYLSSDNSNSDVYRYDIDGKISTQLTFTDSSEWTPYWSKVGRYIAFISDRDGNRELYLYNLESKVTQRLTTTSAIEAAPSLTHDSQKVLFVRFDPLTKSRQIFESTLDGEVLKHDYDSARSYIYPKMSSDGKFLLYGSKLNRQGEFYHIWTRELVTGVEKQVEDMGLVSYNPSWSANGQKILFINQSEKAISTAAIYMMNSDGTDLQQVLTCENGCFQARLSPDGKSILYQNGWAKTSKGIYLYDLTTNENRVIIKNKE